MNDGIFYFFSRPKEKKKTFIRDKVNFPLLIQKCSIIYVINFPGSRRLSVGALVGLGTLLKSDTPKKAAKPTVASSYGSTAGITQGGVTKIRNKTIPIINPMVKSGQWPGTSYKKGTIFFSYRILLI